MRQSININNVVIDNGNVRWNSDVISLFGDNNGENIEDITIVKPSDAKDLPELLVLLGFYESKSQAKKAGRDGKIPEGFTLDFKATKVHRICIWNPTEP